VDLVIERANGDVVVVEIKRTLSPKLTLGLLQSMETLGAKRGTIVIPEGESFPLSKSVNACVLRVFLENNF